MDWIWIWIGLLQIHAALISILHGWAPNDVPRGPRRPAAPHSDSWVYCTIHCYSRAEAVSTKPSWQLVTHKTLLLWAMCCKEKEWESLRVLCQVKWECGGVPKTNCAQLVFPGIRFAGPRGESAAVNICRFRQYFLPLHRKHYWMLNLTFNIYKGFQCLGWDPKQCTQHT